MNHTDVLPIIANPSIAYYENQVTLLFEACRHVDSDPIQLVRKFHPNPDKLTDINKEDSHFTIEDVRLTLARAHGFEDYSTFCTHIHALNEAGSVTARFEKAADAIVEGDLISLQIALVADPALVYSRSDRWHKATLLHYIAANGIEDFRQKTPLNAVKILETLLSAGSKPDALADTYEHNWSTTLDLLVSSTHPDKAGLQCVLIEKLLDYGAAINGVKDNSSPLVTAIYFNFPEAAETLVRRGARVDNIVTVAAMGDIAQVSNWLGENGKLKHDAPLIQMGWMQPWTLDNNLGLAFVWSAMQNRKEVVRFMLDRGVNPAVCDHRQWTALHWAAFYGHAELVALLIERKAPLEARNEFGGTVLDQTLWATTHEEVRDGHPAVITQLLNAGARVHPWWLFDNLTPPLNPGIAELLYNYQL